MINDGLFTSKTNEWATPRALFEELDKEFSFNLDPCANPENAKCEKYFTQEQDGLKQSWTGYRVFCNPPYGREIGRWVEKCYKEAQGGGVCGGSHSCQDRHEVFSPIHLEESKGDKVFEREVALQRKQTGSPLPKYDCSFLRYENSNITPFSD